MCANLSQNTSLPYRVVFLELPLSPVHLPIWLSEWIIGTIFSFFTLVFIIASINKLIRLEFGILTVFSISTIAYKVSGVLLLLVFYFWPELMPSCSYTIMNTMTVVLIQKQAMVLFYYSLFQISTISRDKFFIILFNLVHNSKVFVIYEIAVSIVLLGLNGASYYLAYKLKSHCPNVNDMLIIIIKYNLMIVIIGPNFLAVFAYLACTIYICYSRLIQKSKNMIYAATSNRNESVQFRKNLRLLLKFLALALVFFACSLFQNLFYIYTYAYGDFSPMVLFLGHTGFVLYGIQPLFLIYIHSVLKSSFKSYFPCLFASKLRSNR